MERRKSADQITKDYLDSLLLEVRHIDSVMPDTTMNLFGETFATPIGVSALSHQGNVRENGMAEMAWGAAMAMTCCKDLDHIDRSIVHEGLFTR